MKRIKKIQGKSYKLVYSYKAIEKKDSQFIETKSKKQLK